MKKGFTLIELLVVVAILATLTIMVIPKFTQYSKTQTLKDAAANLQSQLRVVQSNATSGVICKNGNKAGNWSLKIDSTTKTYEIDSDCIPLGLTPTPEVASFYQLPSTIIIASIKALPCNVEFESSSKVVFNNISGAISFQPLPYGCLSSTDKMMITLQVINDSSSTKKVTIDKGGAILISD